MITCPSCNQEIKIVETKKQTDKDFYLEWWTPTLGAKEALKSWEEKQLNVRLAAPRVMSDIGGYQSQVDGSWIDSRSKHRDHLKRHNMVELGNDVPTQQKEVTMSTKDNRERKEHIARQVYEKLRYQ